MKSEIEFKFLVNDNSWKQHVVTKTKIVQGYISTNKELTSRVRTTINLETNNRRGFLTFKGPSTKTTDGASECPELEYEIPYAEAEYLIGLTSLKINKIRNIIPIQDSTLVWEIDEYTDNNLIGLVTAELEIKKGQPRVFRLPSWIGDDVSNDSNYKNVVLAKKASAENESSFNP